ncbi:MAG: hypothetical protein HY403_11445 [Elusimicrobia bacterium]|nr:hypothetical protein [Elusimicrobiota bacterium]
MKILFLIAAAFLAASPIHAADCDSYAPLLKIGWRLHYERIDGPSRSAILDQSECSIAFADHGIGDFDDADKPGAPSNPAPRLRFWSETSPYEIDVELRNGWARVALFKREGRYRSMMARIDQVAEDELAAMALDYTGNVDDREYPALRVGPGVRKTVRSARVLLTPVGR